MGPSLGSDPLAAPLGLRVGPLVATDRPRGPGVVQRLNRRTGGGCLPTGDGLSAILTVILSQKKNLLINQHGSVWRGALEDPEHRVAVRFSSPGLVT